MKLNLVKGGIFPIKGNTEGDVSTGYQASGTFQGEGKLIGTPCLFIRTSACNLRCIAEGSLITMADGSKKAIELIEEGDVILGVKENKYKDSLGRNRNRLALIPQVVLKSWKSLSETPQVELKVGNFTRLQLTRDHTVLVQDHKTKQLAWKEVDRLHSGESILLAPYQESPIETKLYRDGYIVGALYGDGAITKDQVSFGVVNKEFASYIHQIMCEEWGHKNKIYELRETSIGNQIYDLRYTNKQFISFYTEKISSLSSQAEKEFKRGFLAGFFDAEGTHTSEHNCNVSQTKDLDLMILISNWINELGEGGVKSKVKQRASVALSGVVYETTIEGSTLLRNNFLRYLDIKCKYKISAKEEKPFRGYHSINRNEVVAKNLYDLTTELGNFIANEVVVHNCAWLGADGKGSPCDTPYSSHKPEKNQMEIDDIVKIVVENTKDQNIKYVVISGGEPTMQDQPLAELCQKLSELGYHITIETNGTIYENNFAKWVDLYSISPKLSSSVPHEAHLRDTGIAYSEKWANTHERLRINIEALQSFIDQCYELAFDRREQGVNLTKISYNCRKDRYDFQLKFVVSRPEDIEEIERDFLSKLKGVNPDDVVLMPEGVTAEDLMSKTKWVSEAALARGWRFTPRLHVLMFGKNRYV